ncbi:hypothetical protein IEQ34_019372 [Dendrobium chrysotoxum]|uniref:BHLH domain-containing protein n=1 Tax=Dendrobium chrysotoxum TaxID=161865 RepID=A0AAV7G9S5_DENCH|nr:hypothetical protein IEQ34_019372 [Dendrobium chrysotoxum]
MVDMQSPEEVTGNHFRKQLANCVRSIQWSYAIYWSRSTNQEGLLEWNDGFYNGDIKTRKTTQPIECKADQMALQRSEQLRELYESLSIVACNEQNRRPFASLSPEDLTDAEWYYLVCMSFTFNSGQDLPGRVYEHNEPVWLSNAQFADNRTFCRCLLAKTVVGLPFMDGVLELGTFELVLEDPGFVRSIKNSFWEFEDPVSSENSTSSPPFVGKEVDNVHTILDHVVDDSMLFENHPLIAENDSRAFSFDVDSYAPNKQSELMHDNVPELHPSISKKIVSISERRSNDDHLRIKRQDWQWNVHRRNFMDDEVDNGLHDSLNSSECPSRSFVQNILSSPRGERVKGNMPDNLQEDNHAKFGSFGVEGDGSHYACTLSTILGNLKHQISLPGITFEKSSNKSSFKVWKRDSKASKIFTKTPQRMLKNILIDGKWMNGDLVKLQEEHLSRNKTWKTEADDANANHVLSERRRREKLNEKFHVLRSLVPSISKVDKTSILADTIEYLKELERRVEELESYREEADPEMKARRKYPDTAERTSDNYGTNELVNCRKPSSNKRKASEIDEAKDENHCLLPKKGLVDINITMIEKVVLIEMQCPWRDLLLLDIIEAMNNLHLDAQSVQSSIDDGNLSITVRSKFMCEDKASPGTIKRALQRVVSKGN